MKPLDEAKLNLQVTIDAINKELKNCYIWSHFSVDKNGDIDYTIEKVTCYSDSQLDLLCESLQKIRESVAAVDACHG